jgi:hypothetical protein
MAAAAQNSALVAQWIMIGDSRNVGFERIFWCSRAVICLGHDNTRAYSPSTSP